jgi:hypothetical protein
MSDSALPVATNLTPLKTDSGDYDPRVLTKLFDFSAAASYSGEFFMASMNDRLQFVQAVYLDNSLNSSSVTLLIGGTEQSITVQPYRQGVYPIFAITPMSYTISSAGNVVVTGLFLNMPVPFCEWGPDTLNSSSTITVTPVLNHGAAISRNLSLTLGGTAQNIMAVNAARKTFSIFNPSDATGQGIAAAESIFVSFTGAAGVDTGTSYEIVPAGSLSPADLGGFVPTGAISVNAATTAHNIVAIEG